MGFLAGDGVFGDSGRCGIRALNEEIDPNTSIAACVAGGSAPSPPGLQEQGRMLLELLQAALAPGLPSLFPLPL